MFVPFNNNGDKLWRMSQQFVQLIMRRIVVSTNFVKLDEKRLGTVTRTKYGIRTMNSKPELSNKSN